MKTLTYPVESSRALPSPFGAAPARSDSRRPVPRQVGKPVVQRCAFCGGRGLCIRQWADSSDHYMCPTCKGRGGVVVFVTKNEVIKSTQFT